MKRKRVVVAMSGGVDSSVAAALIKARGYAAIGVTLLLQPDTIGAPGEEALKGIESARRVARTLGIPHHVFDLHEEFEKKVIEPFCREYASGLTPNPCILCNRTIKFGALLSRAREMGADHLATGHYAQVIYDEERRRFLLKKGRDGRKDQSYFLFGLSQDQLRSVIFPLGALKKTEVKEMAKECGLSVSDRKESQEICFIPGNDYVSFVKQRVSDAGGEGPIVSTKGELLGRHRGILSFTVGQRRGLNIAKGYPLYVVSVDKSSNTVVVGTKEQGCRKDLIASGINWIAMESLRQPLVTNARIRYKHPENPARVIPLSEDRVKVEFLEPQMAVTPGQAVVFYEDDMVLGGGWIDQPRLPLQE